jgi:hypothetical protein
MASVKTGFFDQLLQISRGELDLFSDATDAFVRTAESTNLSEASRNPQTSAATTPSK